MDVQFLIFPFNADPSQDYNDIWKKTCAFLTTHKTIELKACFLTRKKWLYNGDETPAQQIKLANEFYSKISINKNNERFRDEVLKKYFLNESLISFSSLTCDSFEHKFQRVTSLDGINEELKKLKNNKEDFAGFVHYERGSCTLKWIFIKLGTYMAYLRDIDFFDSLAQDYDAHYDSKSNSFRLAKSHDSKFTSSVSTKKFFPCLQLSNSLPGSKVYPLQKKIGEFIHEKIVNCIKKQNREFNKFKVILLLPPRTSLKCQTITRLSDMLKEPDIIRQINPNSSGEFDFVFMGSKDSLGKYKKLLVEASTTKNSDTLYLIIQDECHWGMAKDGILDKYINNTLIIESKNIFLLHVSATPYNIEVIDKLKWREENLIRWDNVVSQLDSSLVEENEKYFGLKKMLANKKIQKQSDKSLKCLNRIGDFDELSSLLVNKKIIELNFSEGDLLISKPDIAILVEYLVTLRYLLAPSEESTLHVHFVTPETKQILEELIKEGKNGKGSLVVLRMNNSVTAGYLSKWMKKMLNHFKKGDLFDIVLDCDDSILWDSLSPNSKKKYCEWRGQDTIKIPENMTYKNLVDLPILLIVIEKARMGDTLPDNFKYFDLRCRYTEENGSQTIYASLLQDVGRAFGYGERPTVFLTKFIYEKLDSDEFLLKPHQTLVKAKNTRQTTECNDPLGLWKMSNNHQLFGMDLDDVLSRRFLLSAHPQNGKTGAFLTTVELFINHYRNNDQPSEAFSYIKTSSTHVSLNSEMKSLRNSLKSKKASELNSLLNDSTSQVKQDWDEFHCKLSDYKKQLEMKGYELNHKKCISLIENICKKTKESCIRVLDMGCGSAEIAQHFYNSNEEKFVYKHEIDGQIEQKTIDLEIISVDHKRNQFVPDYIKIIECDMSEISNRVNVPFDVIVFCCSMWGDMQDIQNYIEQARNLLKKVSKLIILDSKHKTVQTDNGKLYLLDFIRDGREKKRKRREFYFKLEDMDGKIDFFLLVGRLENEDED